MNASAKKIILISGAAGGLGQELCQQFGLAGYHVVALDVNREALQSLKEKIEATSISFESHVCDLTDEREVQVTIQSIAVGRGRIDALINNAGITFLGTSQRTSSEKLRQVMEVNFMGAVHLTQAALPFILEQKGQITVISSVAGFAPLVGRTAYSASKHALHGYFETLRSELKDTGVEVLMVCPSSITTGIRRNSQGIKDASNNLMEHTTGRSLSPGDAAQQILKAMQRHKRQLMLGFPARVSWVLRKFAPRFYERLMLQRMGPAIWHMEKQQSP